MACVDFLVRVASSAATAVQPQRVYKKNVECPRILAIARLRAEAPP
jgi:hypothetical protein